VRGLVLMDSVLMLAVIFLAKNLTVSIAAARAVLSFTP